MKIRSLPFILFALAAFAGCRPDLSGLELVGVDEVASWQTSRSDITLCDANNDDTRARFGVIPGALLLSSYRDYDAAAELPGEKQRTLVFYCHSEMCGAAADAARKAVGAGHLDVKVMSAGIAGWRDAGRPVRAYARPGDAS
jgi:rhodanese-related sulfurtransferase